LLEKLEVLICVTPDCFQVRIEKNFESNPNKSEENDKLLALIGDLESRDKTISVG
jgi:hypothetical protein